MAHSHIGNWDSGHLLHGFCWETHYNSHPYSSISHFPPLTLHLWFPSRSFVLGFLFCGWFGVVFVYVLDGLFLHFDVLRGVCVCVLICLLICFGIFPAWCFLRFLDLWFCACHINVLFGKFLATITSNVSSAFFLFLLLVFWYCSLSLTAAVIIYFLEVLSPLDYACFYFSSAETGRLERAKIPFPKLG